VASKLTSVVPQTPSAATTDKPTGTSVANSARHSCVVCEVDPSHRPPG
jgi:hypothetical protein